MTNTKQRITDLPTISELAGEDILIVTSGEISYKANLQTIFTTFVGEVTGVSSFLDPPDLFEETADHFYMGWLSVNSGWLIRKQDRPTSISTDATIVENDSYATLALAWAAKDTLVYV